MRVEAETIQAINPNNVEGLLAAGYGAILAGDPEYGRQLTKEALRLQDQQPCRFSRALSETITAAKENGPSRWNITGKHTPITGWWTA
jgi:hypothetical protein